MKRNYGEIMLKYRFVPHGNIYNEENIVSKDSASADIFIMRLGMSIRVMMGFQFTVADIKWAYIQSGPIYRDTYVTPPKRLQKNRRKM